jgi:hypothetical protein
MKNHFVILTAGILAMMSGCSTPTALRVAVGPDPSIVKNVDTDGTLRVFSATEEENDVGFETPYDQRTDYYIYAANGKEIRRVLNNNKGHFEDRPRGIRLPPGTYRIKALAAVGLGEWVIVPVVIEPGRTTGSISMDIGDLPPIRPKMNWCLHPPVSRWAGAPFRRPTVKLG